MIHSLQDKAVIAVVSIMMLEAFAAFFNGAYFLGPMTLFAGGAWVILLFLIFTEPDVFQIRWPGAAVVACGSLVLFWVWTGLSVFWSINPDQTWVEFNRTGGYLAVLMIGVIAGRYRIIRRLSPFLLITVVAAVSVYAVGVKILPSFITNLQDLARISVPLGYTNAVGLFMALAVPFILHISAEKSIAWYFRLYAISALPIILITLFFTLSRGAFVALVVGLTVYFSVSATRLRSFGVALVAIVPASLVAWWSSGQEFLMNDNVDLEMRLTAASQLRVYLVLSIAATAALFSLAMLAGRKVHAGKKAACVLGSVILVILSVSFVAGTYRFVSSKPSFSEWLDETYVSFTERNQGPSGASRLFTMSASGRWQLWQEAVDSWEDQPITGTGAQSFRNVHLLRRDAAAVFVKQPHGLPFRLLSELGIVGLAFFLIFMVVTLTVSCLLLFMIRNRRERSLAAAIICMSVIYLVHTSFDWDWNILAVTMPYFLFTGMMVGWYGSLKGRIGDRALETDEALDSDPQEI